MWERTLRMKNQNKKLENSFRNVIGQLNTSNITSKLDVLEGNFLGNNIWDTIGVCTDDNLQASLRIAIGDVMFVQTLNEKSK